MGFDSLLGNERLKSNLCAAIKQDRISHFYLISGPAGSGKRTLARLLAAAILCERSGADRPCLSCAACRKVMADMHPDFITVDEPEKKTVSVNLIRRTQADVYIQPNEASRKIYLFPRAQDMGPAAQNALLKVLEEPPRYSVFLLLAENPNDLLPTVRSRCTPLPLQPLPERILDAQLRGAFPGADDETVCAAISRSGGFLGQAKALLSENAVSPQSEAFVTALAERDAMRLLSVLVPMEKWKRENFIAELSHWLTIFEEALLCRGGMRIPSRQARLLAGAMRSGELLCSAKTLEKAIKYAQGNVSVATICGYLDWALRS